jgi:hypothetical protein
MRWVLREVRDEDLPPLFEQWVKTRCVVGSADVERGEGRRLEARHDEDATNPLRTRELRRR